MQPISHFRGVRLPYHIAEMITYQRDGVALGGLDVCGMLIRWVELFADSSIWSGI
jgi:hypothetical protein